MKHIFLSIVILITAISLSGCKEAPKPNKHSYSDNIPKWYTNPPKSTSKVIYGTGNGSSVKDSKNNALIEAISKIIVSVESDYSKTTIVNSKNGRKDVENKISDVTKIEVKNIIVSNYNLIEQKKLGFDNYATLVSINLDTIKELYHNKISILYKKNIMLKNRKNDIFLVVEYKKYIEELKEGLEYSYILKYLEPGYSVNKYSKHLNGAIKYLDTLSNNNALSIKSFTKNKSLDKKLEELFIKLNGFKINNTNFKYSVLIKEENCSKSFNYGFYIKKCYFSISFLDNKNNTIKSSTFEYKGVSSGNYQEAEFNMYHKLIKDKDIFKYFEFN